MGSKRMENQTQGHLIDAIAAFFAKFWTWFFYIFMGLLGKIGLILRGEKKQTFIQDISSLMIAGFVGYLAAVWCMYKYPVPAGGYSIQGAIVVPMATLLSDRVISFILNVNWDPVLEFITKVFKKDKLD